MANSYIILGNGFSIDLIKRMNREKQIDLRNLFTKGENVLYPKTKQNKKDFYQENIHQTCGHWVLGVIWIMKSQYN